MSLTPAHNTTSSHPSGGFFKSNPYRGMMRLWCFDLGSASFLFTGLVSLIICCLTLLNDKHEVALFLMAMGIVSILVAIAWQFNRVNGSEWAQLVPHYQANVQWQALSIISTVILALSAMILTLDLDPLFFAAIWISTSLGLLFNILCFYRSQLFHSSFLLFLCAPFIQDLAVILPTEVWFVLVFILFGWLVKTLRQSNWSDTARVTYLNGMEMGWFWLPNLQPNHFVKRLELWLFPVSYFIGPLLIIVLMIMPVIALGLGGLSWAFEWHLPGQFFISQLSIICCGIVHWSRIQRARSTESLYLMPIADGLDGLKQAFFISQIRLIGAFMLIMVFSCALLSLLDPNMSLVFSLHLVLSTCWGCAFILGLGSASRTSVQISLSMFGIGFHSIAVSLSFAAQQKGEDLLLWLLADLLLILVGAGLLMFGKHRLWQNGVIDR